MSAHVIYLAGGCFWGIEAFLRRLDGVTDTECGYANGYVDNPNYECVCTGDSGHTETVRVTYDTERMPLATLLDEFFGAIDPTVSAPVQYQNGVYYEDPADESTCRLAIEELARALGHTPYIDMSTLTCFFLAEDYHQNYIEKHPEAHCHVDLSRLEKKIPDRITWVAGK